MSSADWVHCNACTATPSATVAFAFSSCGHILCKKCLAKTTGTPAPCPYCKKPAQFLEVNRGLKPEIQMLFRNPRDLAAEYMKNLGTVLEFQHNHRARLTRAKAEQQTKAKAYVAAAQGEVKKRIEAEKKAVAENTEIRCELDKTKCELQRLETLLATRELELERIKASAAFHSPAIPQYQRSDSGLGDTPSTMSSLSFLDAMTSTPLHLSPSRSNGSSGRRRTQSRANERLHEIFAQNGKVPSPIVPSPVMATPAMLGYKTKHRSSSENSRRTASTAAAPTFNFDAEPMDLGGGF